jgi:guanylate kinase
MNRIIAIVGESGSGKTTLATLLEKETGLKNIESFTTRKPRYEGEKGHLFTTKKQYECNKANRFVAAETLFDGEYYWTVKDQLNKDCMYVIDVAGVKTLKETLRDAEIIVIYLKCDEAVREQRMIKRYKEKCNSLEQECIDHTKVLERLEHDKEAFKVVECNHVIDANRSIEEVLEDAKSIINSVI